ncbi:hypothetical protein, partial [uncultured Ralstonia sp.]|uniref:hypothetical protein n=1 Tax=uncultured Ralstonia sp. TaxID=114715 RepID=UPI0025CB9060
LDGIEAFCFHGAKIRSETRNYSGIKGFSVRTWGRKPRFARDFPCQPKSPGGASVSMAAIHVALA